MGNSGQAGRVHSGKTVVQVKQIAQKEVFKWWVHGGL